MAIFAIIFTALSYASAIGLFLIIGWYVYVQKFAKYLGNIPGPTPLPVIGNALMFTDSNATLKVCDKLFKEHGKITKVWIGIEPIILVSDYKVIETILSSAKLIEKSQLYKFLHSWLGSGLLTSAGPKWKKRRRMLTPSYHFQILEQFVPTFNKVSNNLVQELKNINNKNCLDIYPYVTLATLDVICETAMGVPINALQNKTSNYVHSVKEMGRITMERVFSPLQQIDLLYGFTENGKTEQECLKILHGHTLSVIKTRKEELGRDPNSSVDNMVDEFGKKKKIAFLDMLLQTTDNGQPLSDDDIREEVDTFMFEGHDTTASGVSFTLYEIANNPDVQKKILEEQNDIFGNDDRDATYQDLANMRYLEMVIKEGLRLYPSVPLYARTAFEDIQLTDDIWCPKGSTIAILAYHIHRDPRFFSDPEKFNPDRFAAENNTGKNPYSFVPFSAGPRNCIGQKFAFMELKSMISKIVRNFELSPVVPAHKPELVAEAILKSNNGIMIKLQERYERTHL